MTSSPMPRHHGATPSRAAALRLRGHTAPVRAWVHWPAPASHTAGRTAGRPTAAPLLVCFGGGAGACGLDLPDSGCRALSVAAGVVVVSMPHAVSAPGAFHDAVAAVEWAADHGAELDADPDRLLVAGQGAGGGLAAAVALHARDHGWPALVRQLLVFPRISPSLADGGSGDVAAVLPRPSLVGVTPATVLTGTGGGFRRDDGRRYAARLRHAGVRVQELRYGGPAHGGRSRSDVAAGEVTERVLADLAGTIHRALARAPPAGSRRLTRRGSAFHEAD